MTANNLNPHPLIRRKAGIFGRGLTTCAMIAAAALLACTASAQTAPAPPSSSAPAPASTPANPNQRPDSAIAEDINSKLMASNTLRPLNLGIWVHDGTATLTGNVATEELRAEAESMVKSVAGVQNVEDKITIGAEPAAAPEVSGPAPEVSGQNGADHNAIHPGDAQGPPPPANYDENHNETPPQPYSPHQLPAMVTVAPGTIAYVIMMQPIDSKHTKIGTPFHGILVQNIVVQNGVIAIPRGADVTGIVVDARGPGKLKGRPQLALQLTGVTVASDTYPMASQIWARGGPGKGGQSAANIGGSAAAGAIIGGAVGGGPTALLGGLLGGLGGAGLSSLSSGPQLYIPAESILTFYTSAPLTVHVPTNGEIRQLASRVPPAAYGRPGYGRAYPPPPGYPPQPVYYPPPPGGPPGGYPY